MAEFTDVFPFIVGAGVGTISLVNAAYPTDPDTPAFDQPQKRIQLASPVAGIYTVTISATWELGSQIRSAYIRFTTDGGTTWEEGVREPKDISDTQFSHYSFPLTLDGSAIDFIVQARREDASVTMDMHFLNLFIQRVA